MDYACQVADGNGGRSAAAGRHDGQPRPYDVARSFGRDRARRFVVQQCQSQASQGGLHLLRQTVLSPQRKSAPYARPARWKDDFAQAGLLACGSSPCSAFPDFAPQSPVALWRRVRRRQLRGQLRNCHANRDGETHRIPSWPVNATGTPKLSRLDERARKLSIRRIPFVTGCRAPATRSGSAGKFKVAARDAGGGFRQ
jgi:hypothetical protein